jgi:hypothetical protein
VAKAELVVAEFQQQVARRLPMAKRVPQPLPAAEVLVEAAVVAQPMAAD